VSRKKSYLLLVVGLVVAALAVSLSCATQTHVPMPEAPTPPQPQSVEPPAQEYPETATPAPAKKIAFVRNFGSYYGSDICTINSDGTDMQRITKGASEDLRPSWSPDGTKIAYCVLQNVAGGGGETGSGGYIFMPDDIFIMDSNGNNKMRVLKGWCPSWLPDSQHIGYMASSSSPCGINTADIEGLDIKTYPAYMGGLRFPVGNFPTLEISPDGKSVAFDYNWKTSRCDICVMSLEIGGVRNLTRNLKGGCYCPTWSPDSTKIAFTMETGEKLNANSMKIEKETAIYTMDADGSNPTLLIENGAYPAWQR